MTQISRTVRGAAQATTLLSDITAAVPGAGGQLAVQLAAQWPGSNFVAIIDRLGANPEKILCSSRVGNTLLVSQRGYDGTAAASHSAGATVEHIIDATLITAILEHVNTDAGLDHKQNYLQTTAKGVAGDLSSIVPGQAAALGFTNKWVDAAHLHPYPSIPAFVATSGVVSVVNNADTLLGNWTATVDSHSGLSSNRYTIPSGWAGVWDFHVGVDLAADGTGTGQRTVEAYKNGTVGVGLAQEQNPGAVPTADLSVSFQVPGLVAGDYIEIHVVQSSGGNLNTGTPTHFSGHWVRP